MAMVSRAGCSKRLLTGLGFALTACFMAGCGGGKEEGPLTAASSKYQVADEASATSPAASTASPSGADSSGQVPAGDADTATPTTPSTPGDSAVPATEVPTPPTMPPVAAPGGGANGYAVPEGKEALLAFLEQLQQQQPKGQDQQQLLEDYRSLHAARIQAADKLLNMSQEKQVRFTATQAKLDAMRALGRLGDRQAVKDLNGYCRTVMKDADPEIVNLGRLMLFGLSLDAMAEAAAVGQVTDVKPLLADLKKLVAEQPNAPGVFMVTRQAAMMMQQFGHKEVALQACQAIGNAYKDSQDEQLAAEARSMLDMAKAQAVEMKLDLDGKLRALLTGQPNSAPAVLDVLKSLLEIQPPGEYVLNVVGQIAQLLEISGSYKEAGEAFVMLENAYKNSPDEELAKQAMARAENGRRRAGLLGQTFVVDGTQVDGSPFDWSKYQGKVVLVDFWATWCGPCLEELPNLKKNYEAYRDKGFEVVGVNLDEDPQTVVTWLARQPLPWTTVISADANARGFDHPLVVKCGIDAIPFIVLLDRDGKVNALHVRGEKLEQKLAQLLGPPGAAEAPTPPAEKPAATPPGAGG